MASGAGRWPSFVGQSLDTDTDMDIDTGYKMQTRWTFDAGGGMQPERRRRINASPRPHWHAWVDAPMIGSVTRPGPIHPSMHPCIHAR